MRRLVSALLSLLLLFTFAPAAQAGVTVAPTGEIVGKVRDTWLAGGGSEVLGDPIGLETKIVAFGRNTYHQHTTLGATVYWDGSQGGKIWRAGEMPQLSGVSNERDALAASGLAPGVVFRSAELCRATTADKRLLTALLHGGLIVNFQTSSAASDCPDPTLPTVTRVRHSLTSTTNLTTFVTKREDREDLARAYRAMLVQFEDPEEEAIVLHCTRGRDRTGWAVSVLLMLGGVDLKLVREEYMRSPDMTAAKFDAGVRAMHDTYGGVEEYLLDGLKLTHEEVADLHELITR